MPLSNVSIAVGNGSCGRNTGDRALCVTIDHLYPPNSNSILVQLYLKHDILRISVFWSSSSPVSMQCDELSDRMIRLTYLLWRGGTESARWRQQLSTRPVRVSVVIRSPCQSSRDNRLTIASTDQSNYWTFRVYDSELPITPPDELLTTYDPTVLTIFNSALTLWAMRCVAVKLSVW